MFAEVTAAQSHRTCQGSRGLPFPAGTLIECTHTPPPRLRVVPPFGLPHPGGGPPEHREPSSLPLSWRHSSCWVGPAGQLLGTRLGALPLGQKAPKKVSLLGRDQRSYVRMCTHTFVYTCPTCVRITQHVHAHVCPHERAHLPVHSHAHTAAPKHTRMCRHVHMWACTHTRARALSHQN